MSIHPDGTGTGWTNVEAVDVDQPHGKDYLYSQHIAKGVRKRMGQEHSTFADATVGGIHRPGGSSILGIDDGTPPAADGTYRGHGIIWDSSSRLWCSTAAAGASTSGNPVLVKMHPDKQWGGGDVTWVGEHDFQAPVCFSAVDISHSLDVTGALACGSTATIMKLLTCSSKAVFAGDVSISGAADVTTPTSDPQIANKKYVDDTPHTGGIVQVVNIQTGEVATGAGSIPKDDTIPQKTEGNEYMTLAITPKSATNKLKIDIVFNGARAADDTISVALFQDEISDALKAAMDDAVATNRPVTIVFSHFMVAGTTSLITFKIRAGTSAAATLTFNGFNTARKFGGVMASSITITEIKV